MKISIHSGLGNQLFQFAFLHFLIDRVGKETIIEVVSEINPRSDRKFELHDLIAFCEHSKNSRRLLSSNKKFQSLFHIVSKISYIKEYNEFTFSEYDYNSIRKFSHLYGYFQHWKYVDSAYYLFGEELGRFMNTVCTKNIIIPKNFVGLHVRRGDNIYTLDSMGSLNYNYYTKILEKANKCGLPIVLFTDDLKGSSDVIEKISPDYCFGPKELSVWQTLKLMSNSNLLITANSTLSWWAALIGFKSGRIKEVFIPDPWFRNWHTKILDSFHFPGFKILQAEFIESSHFITDYELPKS